MEPLQRALHNAATRPYLRAGAAFYPYFFARGKLSADPIFYATLQAGTIPQRARILDLGCGQFLFASLLLAARSQYEKGAWPSGWPEPPVPASLTGIELDRVSADWARKALGHRVSVRTADISGAELPDADVVLLFDVLHYLPDADQVVLLERISHSLRDGGKLMLRVADTGAGWRYRLTRIVDHSTVLMRGRLSGNFFCRTMADWSALLLRHGFRIERQPMSQGTPFANVLLTASR